VLLVYYRCVGQLTIEPENPSVRFRTLLLVIIDRSGSMAGGPISQVKYSLHRILDMAYSQPDFVTHLVTYNDKVRANFSNFGVYNNCFGV
jgi:hypothetical protein